jgi:hypothetical protein
MFLKSESLLALTAVLLSILKYSYLRAGNGMRLAASGVQFTIGKQIFIVSVLFKPTLRPTQPRGMCNWGRFLRGVKRPEKHTVFSYQSK